MIRHSAIVPRRQWWMRSVSSSRRASRVMPFGMVIGVLSVVLLAPPAFTADHTIRVGVHERTQVMRTAVATRFSKRALVLLQSYDQERKCCSRRGCSE
jgi:hypothetical protein